MSKIDKLLYLSIIPPFILTVVILTFVLSVQYLGNLSELLITRNASFETILLISAAIIPGTLIFSLPLSYLIGILIGLSGLSGESQITALRACGVPVRTLLRPVLFFGAFVGLLSGIVTTVIFPRTNDVIAQLKSRVSLTQATNQIQARVFNGGNEDFPNIVFYLDNLAIDRQHWSRIFLSDNSDPKSPRTITAREGSWVTDSATKRLQLHLEGGKTYVIDPSDPSKDTLTTFDSTDIPIPLNPRFTGSLAEDRVRKVVEQRTSYLWNTYDKSPPKLRLEQLIELHRRFALPCAIFPFALLGLTLSVGSHRGGRTSGFALSLILVIIFYMLFANGIRLASVSKLSPWLGVWGANILLTVLGGIFFYRVEQSHAIGHMISRISWSIGFGGLDQRFNKIRTRVAKIDDSILRKTARVARFRFPRVLDGYISKGFFGNFLWSLMVCGTLFVLFTLFDLLDDIIKNRIPAAMVLDYFTFFTPHILMLVVPMSVLLGVLINFGILEKNSEITAIKAGGWSLYRIAVPIFLIAAGLCAGLYLLQDYVLPYANVVQDDLHNRIKGKPPQSAMRLQRKWIFGESDRIYNYEYFDNSLHSFVDLNIYEIDLEKVEILRRIHAARALVDKNGNWTLEDGWIRDYLSPEAGFKRISREQLRLPEKADYFEKEIFQPKESAKMTYLELRDRIIYLMKSGYNATDLQVELHKKIAFPLSCLIMAILGIPFSFSMGKKGALFGIGVSIAIAMSYWGLSGVFEAMGAYGLLIPMLAAWAPNLLFGAAGLVLLFTIRT